MLVRDLMAANPVTVSSEDSLETAMALMVEHQIRGLPVMEGGKLAGILTERDLKMALGPDSRSMQLDSIDPRQLDGVVDWFMTPGVETVKSSARIGPATDKLLELRVGALPVVDDAGALVGILSVTDVLRAARKHFD